MSCEGARISNTPEECALGGGNSKCKVPGAERPDVSEGPQVARVWLEHSEHIWSISGDGRSERTGELFM